MINGPLNFHLFGGTVDFLSCLIGDFLRHPHTSIALQPSQPLPCILLWWRNASFFYSFLFTLLSSVFWTILLSVPQPWKVGTAHTVISGHGSLTSTRTQPQVR